MQRLSRTIRVLSVPCTYVGFKDILAVFQENTAALSTQWTKQQGSPLPHFFVSFGLPHVRRAQNALIWSAPALMF
jgi:hypothetical protein